MDDAFRLDHLTRTFGEVTALSDVSLALPCGRIAGLIGRNGSGKTTLLRHVVGLALPTSGECRTLGCPTPELGAAELGRIGFVHQESRFLPWMSVRQLLAYAASFHEAWDREREERLLAELELDPGARVSSLSPGNVQKLAILLAVCHHPQLLLLDEPVSALDPIARESMLSFLLEMVACDELTLVVSSHVLRDVERVVDWIICLDGGRLVENAPLSDLQERYAEWRVTPTDGDLPPRFEEEYVLSRVGGAHEARILVRGGADRIDDFQRKYRVRVNPAPVDLERIFPLLIGEERG